MFRVCIGNSTHREWYDIGADVTIREAFERAGIDYAMGLSMLNGVPLSVEDMDKTLVELGAGETCVLLNAAKLTDS